MCSRSRLDCGGRQGATQATHTVIDNTIIISISISTSISIDTAIIILVVVGLVMFLVVCVALDIVLLLLSSPLAQLARADSLGRHQLQQQQDSCQHP